MRSFRAEINRVLRKKLKEYPNILLLGQSIRDPFGGAFKVTRGLTKDFDDRIIDLPISEAASVGLVQGLAYQDYIPILEIMFSDFLTLCTDQIYNGLTRLSHVHGFSEKLKIVIRVATGAGKRYGSTHSQNLEMLFVGCPGVQVYTPGLTTDLNSLYTEVLANSGISIVAEDKFLYDMKMIDQFRFFCGGMFRITPYGLTKYIGNINHVKLKVVAPAYFGHYIIELVNRYPIMPILIENMTLVSSGSFKFMVDDIPFLVINPYIGDIFPNLGAEYVLRPSSSFIPCSEDESQVMITREKIEGKIKEILYG